MAACLLLVEAAEDAVGEMTANKCRVLFSAHF